MKKVMLFIASMLFAVSVNAATISITQDLPTVGAFVTDSNPNNAPLAVTDFEVTATDVEIFNEVINTGGTWSKVKWTFNPEAITGQVYDFSIASLVDVSGLDGYSFVMYMADGASNYMDFIGTAVIGSTIALSVQSLSEVPVPAALFLFAPALLGFFGLRRKAALAA